MILKSVLINDPENTAGTCSWQKLETYKSNEIVKGTNLIVIADIHTHPPLHDNSFFDPGAGMVIKFEKSINGNGLSDRDIGRLNSPLANRAPSYVINTYMGKNPSIITANRGAKQPQESYEVTKLSDALTGKFDLINNVILRNIKGW